MVATASPGPTRPAKAVGTRDRVVEWLARNGDLRDPSGMASGLLAREIGYPGTSIAFAQLLSGMERSGLISREVRGKRTYAVTLTEAGRHRSSTGRPAVGARTDRRPVPRERAMPTARGDRMAAQGVDLDDLAVRLLVQVARRLSQDGAPLAPGVPGARPSGSRSPESQLADLETRVAALEHELAAVRRARLAAEEDGLELRSPLERLRDSLEAPTKRAVRDRMSVASQAIDHADIALLRRLLAERGESRPAAQTGEADSA